MVRSVVLGFFGKVNSTGQRSAPNTVRASIHRDPERRGHLRNQKYHFLKYLLVPGRSLIPSTTWQARRLSAMAARLNYVLVISACVVQDSSNKTVGNSRFTFLFKTHSFLLSVKLLDPTVQVKHNWNFSISQKQY